MGWEGGRVELLAGTNKPDDPDKIDLITYNKATGRATTRKWIAPEDLAALWRHVCHLAELWGNVYASVGTYDAVPNPYSDKPGATTYNRSAPRPRRCLVLDDVTDLAALPLPPTWANETSYRNYQVGYFCHELLTLGEAEALGKGAALRAGADPSGFDATQLIRVPGTLNTKAKCAGRPGDPQTGQEPEGWRVRLVHADGPRYSRQQLAETFLAGGLAELDKLRRGSKQTNPKAARKARPGAELEAYHQLPDGAALMTTARHKALWANRPQLAALARGERLTLMTERGPDDTGNQQVAVLVANYLTTGRPAYPGGPVVPGLGAPPLDEIRAVALHWRETLRPGFPLADYQRDVEGLIAKYTPEGYAPEPTKGLTGSACADPVPLPPPRHRGRPAGQRAEGAEQLANHLAALPVEADGVRRTCRAELARKLRITERMVTAYLADLRTAGRLDTRTEARALAVLRVEIKSPPIAAGEGGNRPPAEGVRTRETASEAVGSHSPAPPAVAPPLQAEAQAAAAAGCVPPSDEPLALPAPKPAAPLTLRELVRDGMDAYGHDLRKVLRYLAANGAADADPAAVRWLYADELRRRQWARADEALRIRVEAMRPAARQRQLKRLADRVKDARTTAEERVWQRKYAIVASVIEACRQTPPGEAEPKGDHRAPKPAPLPLPLPLHEPAPEPWRPELPEDYDRAGLVTRLKALRAPKHRKAS